MAPSSLHSPEEAAEVLPLESNEAAGAQAMPDGGSLESGESSPGPQDDVSINAGSVPASPADVSSEPVALLDEPVALPDNEAVAAVVADAADHDADAVDASPDADDADDASLEDDDASLEDTVAISPLEPPMLRYFTAGGRVFLRIGPGESPEDLRLALVTASLPEGPIWLAFEERPPTPDLVNELSAVLTASISRSPAGIRCGVETLIAGAGASMGLPVEVPPARPAEDTGHRNVMVIERTLRSGAAVRSKGDVLVYGDVNAGAQIEADGNIVVLGSLRGLAHAGRGGDESAIIISFDLRPTQIRIGRRIAFPPAQSRGRSTLPEVARICDGEIVLQDYRGRLSL